MILGRFDDLDEASLPAALFARAERRGDDPWIEPMGESPVSFGRMASDACKVAAFLRFLGVGPGEHVAILMSGGPDFLRAWFALAMLDAVAVPLNTDLRGGFLVHQLRDAGARLAMCDAGCIDALRQVADQVPLLERVVRSGADDVATDNDPAIIDFSGWRTADPLPPALPDPRHVGTIMYTSGTSGPAKGVLMPHRHCALYGVGALRAMRVGANDKYYVCLPFFHANGLLMQAGAALLAGIPAAVRARFSATSWLEDIRHTGATLTNLLGALASFVLARPPTPMDRAHRLRAILNGPNPPPTEQALRERFGVADVLSGYGMTECNIPVWGRVGHARPGACGWVDRRHFDLIVADPETDRPLPPGETGEILVRPKLPFGFMAGYHANSEATVMTWRNLWFHTGDAGVLDADDVLTFVDRLKDCIRRRGENISAAEIELVVSRCAGVAEAAAFAAPSEVLGGEDEVAVAVVAAAGAQPSAEAIVAEADPQLPRFARPRYLLLIDALPKTATGKVQRAMLRRFGTAGAWDRSLAPRSDGR